MINNMTSSLLSKRTRKWSVEVGVVLTAVHLHLLVIVNVNVNEKMPTTLFPNLKRIHLLDDQIGLAQIDYI